MSTEVVGLMQISFHNLLGIKQISEGYTDLTNTDPQIF